MSHGTTITDQQYQQYIDHAEKYGRDLGLDKVFDDYNVNIILAPVESEL